MRIVVHGQQAFGKAVLEALLKRDDEVIAVYAAPEKPGQKIDPLKEAALAAGLPVHQPASYRKPETWEQFRALKPDLQVMAYVTLFVPEEFLKIPSQGSIQYHPSLLPKFRGPSSINWPIIKGDAKTGLSIFRPTDGLDEGPVILQKETPIGADDTLGTVYFERLFPLGAKAMLEPEDLVISNKHREVVQDESQASYEGWCRRAEARINWANQADFVYNLVRGCNPAPGAWTTLEEKELQIFDARKHPVRTFGAVKGKIGEIVELSDKSFQVSAQGGRIEVLRAKLGDGKKLAAAELLSSGAIKAGAILGN